MKLRTAALLIALGLSQAVLTPAYATVSTETRTAGPYTGNGVTTSFAFTFKVFAKTDLVVTHQTGGVETVKTVDVHYSVTLNANQDSNPGGTITYPISGTALSASETLTIDSAVPRTQGVDLLTGGPFLPNVIENALDRNLIISQQLKRDLDRSIKQPRSDSAAIGELPTKANRASKYLAFDTDGDPVASAGTATATTAAMTGVTDSAGYFAGSDVETVLAEIGTATRTFGTIALLKAGTARYDGEVVNVTSYYTSTNPDGGGGQFKWVAASTDAVDNGITFQPDAGGAGRWKRVYSGAINVKWFGAKGDNSNDDTAEIQAAIDAAESTGSDVYIPQGTYVTSASLTIDGDMSVRGAGNRASVISVDAAVLEGVKVGSSTMFEGGLYGFSVKRASYSGATENIGFAFYDAAQATFQDIESRLSKYNFFLKPGDGQRVAYCTFINIQGISGLYNITGDISGTGFANELVFIGGRMFDSADTDTHVYIDWNANHLRFYGMSTEGTGTQAFYINGTSAGGAHSNVIHQCRAEGTWSSAAVVFGSNTQRNIANLIDLYSTVSDSGTNNVFYTSQGSTIQSATNGSITLKAVNNGSTDSSTIQARSTRFAETNKPLDVVRDSDGLNLGNINGVGRLTVRAGLKVENGGYNFYPLQIGTRYIWVDTTNILRLATAQPSADTDGTVFVGNKVSADKGNAAATLTWGTSEHTAVWNTPLTADRAVTLSTTGAANGARFRVVRTANATGAFNLNVGTGPLKALTAGQWADFEYDGSAWMLTAFGSL